MKAFDENSAANVEEAKINLRAILDLMEKNGFIKKTSNGKIFDQKGSRKAVKHLITVFNGSTINSKH